MAKKQIWSNTLAKAWRALGALDAITSYAIKTVKVPIHLFTLHLGMAS
jgi:hypothetical protein